MRIGLLYTMNNTPHNQSCGEAATYGEYEDYNVVITSSSLSTNEVKGQNNLIKIYPNPVSDVLNVTKVSDNATYKIYNAVGQLIIDGKISKNSINVSSLVR